ncbi:hypothetical protein [Acuticoccus sp.]|uniref:hypothetical protein n=1 Tax=Acuticoccus sp. TaxID=1904378 RepID=UPI003B521CC7
MAERRIPADAERRRRQRQRSLAIGAALVALAVVFYIITIIQLGSSSGAVS